ncbi:MAG: hypothetical protein COU81_00260 [Candidatus Portnoybacteria bacterium CG10_big_fil_rev_8_21_14_0_10_36_7]|uniref:Membrane fusion protein biotin-lipoyl like domain-containing protein n=1 Tax=Candidatus Portnoybacteria bacterium CG10_big_fil_rev_8_21_14_0_10_36_7 TaxID=1974812 RepID=A0A2M8KF33_9BACT|nr:MAG: hypothetical protein COU81_00260 [Candidatus Portnoybacteria bacterium CG10_big_fil_rev_8_21_14_0_10_36_7]
MKFTKKNIIIGVIIVIIIIGIFVATRKSANLYQTATAERTKIVENITATGNVQAAQNLGLAFKITGRVANISAVVGKEVKTGDELAKLETSEFFIRLSEAQANIQIAQAKLAQLKAGAIFEEINVTKTTLNNAINNSEKEITTTEQNLADVITKASEDIQSAYKDAINDLATNQTIIQNSINSAKTVLDDVNVNSYLDTGALNTAKDNRSNANSSYLVAKSYINIALMTQSNADIYNALDKLLTAINDANIALSATNEVLYNSTVTFALTLTTLDAYKTSIAIAHSNANTSKTNITNTRQSIASQKTTNSKNINTAQNNYETTKTYWASQVATAQKILN